MAAAVAAAKSAEAVVFVIGGDWKIEHEGMDRSNISLPGDQAALVTRVRAAVAPTVPVVTVLVHGGSMDISEVLRDSDAVLDSFYPCGSHLTPHDSLPGRYSAASRCSSDDANAPLGQWSVRRSGDR